MEFLRVGNTRINPAQVSWVHFQCMTLSGHFHEAKVFWAVPQPGWMCKVHPQAGVEHSIDCKTEGWEHAHLDFYDEDADELAVQMGYTWLGCPELEDDESLPLFQASSQRTGDASADSESAGG